MRKKSLALSGFTLVEILAATFVAAMLMSAIVLNLGVRDAALSNNGTDDTRAALSRYLDEIQRQKTTVEIQNYVGVAATASDLSDPVGSSPRKLVVVSTETVGSGVKATELLTIRVEAAGESLTRWLVSQD